MFGGTTPKLDVPDQRVPSGPSVCRSLDHARSAPVGRPCDSEAAHVHPDDAHGHRDGVSQVPHQSAASGVSLPPTQREDHSVEPCLGGRYHLHSDAPQLRVPVCGPGLGQLPSAGVAAVQHADDRFLYVGGSGGRDQYYGTPNIFNTDQGCEFTSPEFTGIMKTHGNQISMDGTGCWRDNVFVERLWKCIKYKEVYLHAYETVSAVQQGLERYLTFYNQYRPHRALDGQTPDGVYFDNLPTRRTAR